MKRTWIRLLGFCVSIFGLFIGKNAEAIIDNTVYMQCETSVGGFDVHSTDGGIFKWAACDDGWSNYIYANGKKLMDAGFENCMGYGTEGIQPIFTGFGDGTYPDTPCFCSYTGVACPDSPAWREILDSLGCVENGDGEKLYDNGCYFFEHRRGLYMKFVGCQNGFAEIPNPAEQFLYFTGLDGWAADPSGYCYLCPGLGYDGDSFYLTTGMSPSGQFSWGAGPNSGDACQAKVNGSLTNSKGTFTVTEPCLYDEYYYEY